MSTVSSKTTDFLREVRKHTAVGAIAMLVMGILILLGTVAFICKAMGLVILALGIIYTLLYFINLSKGARVSNQILWGVSCLVLGFIFYYKGAVLESLLGLFFAFALAVDGGSKLDQAVAFLRSRRDVGWLLLLLALAAIVVSVLIVLGKLNSTRVIGICLIVEGAIDLLTLMLLSNAKRPARTQKSK